MFNLDWFDTWIYHIIGWPVLILLLCICIWIRVNWKIAIVLLPASFIALAFLTIDIEKIFGRPYPALPKGEWSYLYHTETPKSIELLVLDKQGTRLYSIKHTKENREQLEKMSQRQSETGVQQMGEFKEKKEGHGQSTDKTELIYYDFPYTKFLKK
tara:strand:- start:1464 stop:1931 length:468 start_codon:yes stop_codon:yes gene_type:complete